MAMGTERSSKALHNFTMPRDLRWGNQRFLRCIKLTSNAQISPPHRFAADNSPSSDHCHRNNSVQQPRSERGREREILNGSHNVCPAPASDGRPKFGGGGDDGIAAMREKVMFDLQTAADKMKDAIFKDGLEEDKVSGSPPPPSAEDEVHRPWNLRTRRAGCKTPASKSVSPTDGENAGGGGRTLTIDVAKPNSINSQKQAADNLKIGETATAGEKRERPKFSVALSKREIEEDYMQIVGHRPPRRPKKRARTIQRQLDTLFPGLWLSEITADMYKVSEDVS